MAEPQLEGFSDAAPEASEPTFSVGRYAKGFVGFMRGRPRVLLIGEITGLRLSAKAAYFELRDSEGALPCSMWRDAWDRMKLPEGTIRDGTEVVVRGGPDYYPGSAASCRSRSPSPAGRSSVQRNEKEGEAVALPG